MCSLFHKKTQLINTILHLNTAFSVIDKIFLQEIANAEIKKNNRVRFFLYNMFCWFPKSYNSYFLPKNYVPVQNSGGKLYQNILGF